MANEEHANGYYGMVQSPFAQADGQESQELLGENGKIIQQCKNDFHYISKLGIHYVGNYDLDLNPSDLNYTNYDGTNHPIIVIINNMPFQIGKTRMLELENVQITSIIFPKIDHDLIYVDYQYK